MNTNPSPDDLLEAVIIGIDDDILPALNNPKAQATAVMMQSVLQGVRQLLQVYDANLVDEHNAMTKVLRDVADALADIDGEAAGRVRDRAATLGSRDDLPAPLDRAEVMDAHRALGKALAATLVDLDDLQRAGAEEADAALELLRGHLGPRYVRDVAAFTVGQGFIGRG